MNNKHYFIVVGVIMLLGMLSRAAFQPQWWHQNQSSTTHWFGLPTEQTTVLGVQRVPTNPDYPLVGIDPKRIEQIFADTGYSMTDVQTSSIAIGVDWWATATITTKPTNQVAPE
jgi:hypothetical protein